MHRTFLLTLALAVVAPAAPAAGAPAPPRHPTTYQLALLGQSTVDAAVASTTLGTGACTRRVCAIGALGEQIAIQHQAAEQTARVVTTLAAGPCRSALAAQASAFALRARLAQRARSTYRSSPSRAITRHDLRDVLHPDRALGHLPASCAPR